MRKTELIVSGEVIHPKTKASIVGHEQTNIEVLLDQQNRTSSIITQSTAMSQVGVGDDMDLSFCVEDGFYESATFHGKTLVNCIQEPSSQDVVLPYEFADGQYVTINDTKESGTLGVELKGQTLVNIHDKKTPALAAAQNDWYSNLVIETNSISFTVAKLPENWRYINFKSLNLSMLKPNTKYLVAFEEASGVSTVTFNNGGGTQPLSDTVQIVSNKAIVTTTSNWVNSAQILFIYVPANKVGTEVKVKNPMIIEYVEGMENWDIPYFEGMASCKMPILTTTGKNLTSLDICYDTFMKTVTGHNNTTFDNGILKLAWNGTVRRANLIENVFKPNTQYTLSYWCKAPEGYAWQRSMIRIKYTDGTGSHLSSDSTSSTDFTRQILVSEPNKTVESVYVDLNNVLYINQIQLEESTTATPYEPYKSSILSLPEDVVLRGIGDVKDTLNLLTGELTQRIGEIVLDGSHNIVIGSDNIESYETMEFFIEGVYKNGMLNHKQISDKLPYDFSNDDYEHFYVTYQRVIVFVKKSKLATQDTNGFKQWLSQNPITIQYELATESIKTVDLNVVDQNGSVIPTLKSWNTTTHIYSEIPENTLYPTLSHSNPSYPVILKPSTKYSIVANSYSNNHTNSTINFNLGGATATTTVGNRVTTITTPSTLSNELLTMSGRGNKLNNVMVIEGDVMGDEPYFEGICDCKSPILSNIGKNLLDVESVFKVDGNTVKEAKDGSVVLYKPSYNSYIFETIKVKANTTYTISCEIEKIIDGGRPVYGIGGVTEKKTAISDSSGNLALFMRAGDQNSEGEYKFYNIQLEEGSTATSYESYKSNILSANGDKIELTEDMFEQGTTAPYVGNPGKTYQWLKENSTPSFDVRRLRLKELIKIQPNTKLILQNTDDFMYAIAGYDANKLSLGTFDTSWIQNTTITIPQDAHYISFSIRKKDDTGITINDFKNTKFTLSEVDKTIVLRSLPNGVCDTLNVETGEYVQRIGECRLDGSEAWYSYRSEHHGVGKSTFQAFCTRDLPKTENNEPINCDLLVQGDLAYNGNIDVTKYQTNYIHNYTDGTYTMNRLFVSVNKEMFGGNAQNNYDEAMIKFKSWVASNPITVQYELTTPIIKTVDLSGYPFSYENGYVILSSGSIEQSLTPKIEYVVQTNRAGAIQANQDRLLNHDKRLAMLEDLVLHQLIQLEYNRAKCTFLSQTRQIFEGGIQMYHTKCELLSEFIEKKLYRSLEEVLEMLDVYFMLGDITDGEYDALYEALMPSAEEIFEVEEMFDHEDVEV